MYKVVVCHYNDVKMGAMASQITSHTIFYSTVYSGVDQRKHQSPASLAFVRGIHREPVNSPHKWPVTRKMFTFDDVTMVCYRKSKYLIFRRGAGLFYAMEIQLFAHFKGCDPALHLFMDFPRKPTHQNITSPFTRGKLLALWDIGPKCILNSNLAKTCLSLSFAVLQSFWNVAQHGSITVVLFAKESVQILCMITYSHASARPSS